nr:hypothetical protein [Streptomyces incarnatus]
MWSGRPVRPVSAGRSQERAVSGVAQGAGAPPGSVAGGVPPHCSTREDVVNSPDSSGRSPPATGIDHCPVTSCPGAAGAGGSSKVQCWVAPGLYENRSSAACAWGAAFGSGHSAPPAGALQVPFAAGSPVPGATAIRGGT